MQTKYYSDFESLTQSIEKIIPEILKEDVAPVAENILKKNVKEKIYDAYTPKPNGWVKDTGNWFIRMTYRRRNDIETGVYSRFMSNHTLFVSSEAKANTPVIGSFIESEGAFLKLLESGNMGLWKGGFSRPAVGQTQKDFSTSKDIEKSIRRGITKKINN